MSQTCLFCSFVKGELPCHKIWESAEHLSFLTIFPNTLGAAVVIPKQHHSSYAFALPDNVLTELVLAAKTVAHAIDSAFDDVGRTGLVFEGFGVDHVHAKLFPLHGTKSSEWKPISSKVEKYFKQYEGYISSHDYTRQDDSVLAETAAKIRAFSGM